ncbi:MAG: DegV family protein [Chloroflexi bacterium]|jgi:DegV family protein with EDD domain|nr:DegV family protein [Chloroflexota bacterium]
MSKVAIVTDSTAYLPKDLVEKYNMTVVPLTVIWGEETYRDDIDITPTQFYTRLETANVMPTTSQATIQDFKDAYERLHSAGYEILSVLISSKLSGTISSAEQAYKMVPDATIEIFDSETTAMALGFQALAAARAAAEGADLAACKAAAADVRSRSGVIFAVDTLEFLHRGGRIGGASRFLGTALKLKPLLEVTNGVIEPVDKVRTKRKAHERLIEVISERVAGKKNIRLATLHANSSEDANRVLDDASARMSAIEAIRSEVSPVIGTHVGPGTVGLAYTYED